MKKYIIVGILMVFASICLFGANPPGTVINHISKDSGMYIGSPSICVMPSGIYVASNDYFGPRSTEYQSAKTDVFISKDKGRTWLRQASLTGQFWSNLFCIGDTLYIFGTNKHHGNVVIRKSMDEGKTWTIPYDSENGLLLEGEYHTAPVPILIHDGRIWRALEYATAKTTKWGERYSSMVMSASLSSDLLDSGNWVKTNRLGYDPSYLDGNFQGWLEGNVVVSPQGRICNLLRVASKNNDREYIAIAGIGDSPDSLAFDCKTGFHEFNGGSKKFTVRYDEKSGRYLTLANIVDNTCDYPVSLSQIRNRVALCSSTDLLTWTIHSILLEDGEYKKKAFQYIDWQIEDNDLILVSRTSFDDETGGAYSAHNANYMTFHKVRKFRKLLNNRLNY